MRAPLASLPMVLLTALLLVGCADSDGGSSDDSRTADPASEDGTTSDVGGDEKQAATEHVDGTVAIDEDDQLIVTPAGRAPITMELDEGVPVAKVRGLETTDTNARVTFVPATGDDGTPVAVDVRTTPRHEGQRTFTGKVTKVDATSITIVGAEGTKKFAMGIQDEHEIEHLGEHMEGGDPVTVFLSDVASDAGETVVAYEDA